MLHRFRHGAAHLASRNQFLDRFDRALRAGELDKVHTFGRCNRRRPALPPNPVTAQVQRDTVQPRRELRLPLESRERAERAQKRLLDDVARIFFAADRPVREGINRPFPAEDQLVEAVSVAINGPSNELFVGPSCPDQAGAPCRYAPFTG
jgi:hypothetical protein